VKRSGGGVKRSGGGVKRSGGGVKRSRAAVMRAGAAVILALALAGTATAAAGPEPAPLAPYARLAAGPEGRALLGIARRAMEAYWAAPSAPGRPAREDSGLAAASPDAGDPADTVALPEWPGAPAGVYVSLVRGRATRACVGSPVPLRGTLVETVRALAVEALRADPRRPPVRRHELEELRIVLSFVDEGEVLANPMSVDPGREGLLVSSPRGAVAFLPGEARTVRWALGEARRAGVLRAGHDDASYRRLRVVTLSEPERPPASEETEDGP
jgi:AMMECR1 domain-containing protein